MMTGDWLFVGAAVVITWTVLAGYFIHVRRAIHAARMMLQIIDTPVSSEHAPG